MEAVVLHRVGFLVYFCPIQGQDFKPSAAPLYRSIGQQNCLTKYFVLDNFFIILFVSSTD